MFTVEIWPLPPCFIPNNTHEKIFPSDWLRAVQIFLKTVWKRVDSDFFENSVEKK